MVLHPTEQYVTQESSGLLGKPKHDPNRELRTHEGGLGLLPSW